MIRDDSNCQCQRVKSGLELACQSLSERPPPLVSLQQLCRRRQGVTIENAAASSQGRSSGYATFGAFFMTMVFRNDLPN
jgi:hypothetical protein